MLFWKSRRDHRQLYPKTILALSDTNYRLKPEQSDTIPDNLPSIPAAIKVNGQSFNVTDIADNAMKNNKKVTKLTVGKNIEHIGKNAFRGCKNLKKIVFKTKKLTTEKIGSNAFKGINSRARFITPE